MLPSQQSPDLDIPPAEILDKIAQLARFTRILHTQYLEHLGLESGQAALLRLILEMPGITQAHATEILKMNRSNVCRRVKVLMEHGLIERKRNPDGGRSKLLVSKRLATWYVKMFREADQELLENIFGGFSNDEMDQFLVLLRRATVNVSHVLHSPPDPRPAWVRNIYLRRKGF